METLRRITEFFAGPKEAQGGRSNEFQDQGQGCPRNSKLAIFVCQTIMPKFNFLVVVDAHRVYLSKIFTFAVSFCFPPALLKFNPQQHGLFVSASFIPKCDLLATIGQICNHFMSFELCWTRLTAKASFDSRCLMCGLMCGWMCG